MLFFFFFNDTATTEIYTLSLHDALPISVEIVDEIPMDVQIIELTAIDGFENDVGRCVRREAEKTRATFCLQFARCREATTRSEEHTSELQSLTNLVCRLLLEKKKNWQADPNSLRLIESRRTMTRSEPIES